MEQSWPFRIRSGEQCSRTCATRSRRRWTWIWIYIMENEDVMVENKGEAQDWQGAGEPNSRSRYLTDLYNASQPRTHLQQQCLTWLSLILPLRPFAPSSAQNVHYPHRPGRKEWLLNWTALPFLSPVRPSLLLRISCMTPQQSVQPRFSVGIATFPNLKASSTAPAMVTR